MKIIVHVTERGIAFGVIIVWSVLTKLLIALRILVAALIVLITTTMVFLATPQGRLLLHLLGFNGPN